jgi:DNA-binding CsgD family transcriptional regulator
MLPSKQEQLSHLLGSLYDAAADPNLWAPFLQQLAQRTCATSAALVVHDFDHAPSTISCSWQLDPESVRLYQEHYYTLDIWARRGLAKPVGYVCNSEWLCPLSEMRIKEIYNDFLAPDGVEHGMFGLLEKSKSRFATISLYRNQSRSEFRPEDLNILQFLVPHLQRSFMLHSQFSELRSRTDVLETALDMLPTGVIFLGPNGEIVLMNRSATSTVAERDGLLSAREGLRAEQPVESSLLAKTILEAVSTANGIGLSTWGAILVSRRMRPALQIVVCPTRDKAIDTSQPIAAVAFVIDPLRRQRPAQDMLRALFGLTPAECRVALLLGDGHSPREIAKTVGVSFETVRSQIKSIFSKTNVKRQGELIRLLLDHTVFAIRPNT